MSIKDLKSAKTKLGNTIELVTSDDFESEENVLIIGVFHGDEPQGKYLIDEYLANCPPSKSKILVPTQVGDMRTSLPKNIIQLAKNLRNNSTKPEIILWQYIKNKNFGVKFRRQVPIRDYIVDFVSHEIKLAIELDGGHHNEPEKLEYDKKRSEILYQSGFTILRFWNADIYKNLNSVLEKIYETIERLKNCTKSDRCLPVTGVTGIFDSSATSCPPLMGGPESLIPRGVKTRKLFISCLNPDGMQKNTRTNANKVDLNRNFPTKNWGEDGSAAGSDASAYFGGIAPASEIETRFVIDIIEEYKPKLILTLHAPYKVVNYDGPAKEIAEKISAIINYPVEASIGYPTPGSFGTYCGVERSIPIITLELDEKIPVEELIQPVSEIFNLF